MYVYKLTVNCTRHDASHFVLQASWTRIIRAHIWTGSTEFTLTRMHARTRVHLFNYTGLYTLLCVYMYACNTITLTHAHARTYTCTTSNFWVNDKSTAHISRINSWTFNHVSQDFLHMKSKRMQLISQLQQTNNRPQPGQNSLEPFNLLYRANRLKSTHTHTPVMLCGLFRNIYEPVETWRVD